MAETVGQHPVGAFSTPINGDTTDADVVRGHFNTQRLGYTNHDSDPGIHVQSSTTGARPAAGSLGRKWLTLDAGVAKLWYDNGTDWVEVTGLTFAITNGQPGLYNAGNQTGTYEVNWNNGPLQLITFTGHTTLSFINASAGASYTLILRQDATGGRTVTLTGWDFGDNLPSYNTAANLKNMVSAVYDGSEYLAAFAVQGAT